MELPDVGVDIVQLAADTVGALGAAWGALFGFRMASQIIRGAWEWFAGVG
jgi:hypothetical protein